MNKIADFLIESDTKWNHSMGNISVGTKIKYKGQSGIVSEDATSDGYSIIKIKGKEITVHNSDLSLTSHREPKPKNKKREAASTESHVLDASSGYLSNYIGTSEYKQIDSFRSAYAIWYGKKRKTYSDFITEFVAFAMNNHIGITFDSGDIKNFIKKYEK
jgi:hypothetical protein